MNILSNPEAFAAREKMLRDIPVADLVEHLERRCCSLVLACIPWGKDGNSRMPPIVHVEGRVYAIETLGLVRAIDNEARSIDL